MASNCCSWKLVSGRGWRRWGAGLAAMATVAILLALWIPGVALAATDPTITSISPNSGIDSGGTTVTIVGTGFTYGMSVTFGGVAAPDVVVVSGTKVLALSPAHATGTVQVKAGNSADTPADDFEYYSLGTPESFATQTITTFPSTGGMDTGRGNWPLSCFDSSAERLAWDGWDGKVWHVYTWDQAAGTQDISVGTGSNVAPVVSGNRVVWRAGFQVYTWTPTGGTVQLTGPGQTGWYYDVDGDRVVWTGDDPTTGTDHEIFMWTPATGTTAITSNTVADYYPRVSGGRIAWLAENGSTSVDVMTWTSAGVEQVGSIASSSTSLDISGDRLVWGDSYDLYTWTPGAAAPQKLGRGTYVAVDGDRVAWSDGGHYPVIGNDRSSVCTWTPTEGTVSLDVEGDIGDLAVSGDRLVWRSSVSGWAYDIDAHIYSWTPGAGVSRISSNESDYVDCSYRPCVSGNRITWLQKRGVVTRVMSAVVTPTVNSITPNVGTSTGGNTVTVNGTGFYGVTGAAGVTFDGVNATSYTVDSSTKITAVVPAHASGAVEVVVNGSDGASPTDGPGNDYAYADAPTITSITPNHGTCTGGATVTINGTGFYGLSGASAITFGGVNAASYTVDSPTSITAHVPAHAVGSVDVAVTAAGGTSDSSGIADNYEYTLQRYEQSLSSLGYSGGWTTFASSAHSGGSYKYTNIVGSSVTIAFNGTQLDWITAKGPMFGIADVVVDSGAASQVDLYDPAVKCQQDVYSTGQLVSGLHTVTITCKGTKNASATNTYVGIDAVETDGTFSAVSYAEQRDPRVLYKGTWSAYANAAFSGGSFFFSKTPGSIVVVPFTGQRLDWIATKGPIYGKANVSVDGGAVVTVDLYAASTKYQQVAYSTGNLTSGPHTLTISYTGTKSSAATGAYINADAFRVVGALTSAARFDQTDAKFVWTKTWSLGSSSHCYGSSQRYVNLSGASVRINFTGASFTYVATKAPNMGKAYVSVDGGAAVLVDLYSAATIYQQKVWSSGALIPGDHSVTITWSGQRRAAATGTYINIDAVDVVGTPR